MKNILRSSTAEMRRYIFIFLIFVSLSSAVLPEPTSTSTPVESKAEDEPAIDEPPEGYYAFVESPNATPPRVRPPPYRQVSADCPGAGQTRPHVSADNLCGDLNRGLIPKNPMGQNPNGEPYPFELIRNQTLRFLSRTLPVLRADDTLPRVAHLPTSPTLPGKSPTLAGTAPTFGDNYPSLGGSNPVTYGPAGSPTQMPQFDIQHNRLEERGKRALEAGPARESKKFCDGGGVFCMLYRAINGESESPAVERREDPGAPHRYEGPPTPCPARVEYATPVFARNYQGVWRYVVQIPYEGYFTQTLELTRCMQSRCHYLEGGCLSSPRWVSLLVAELHYPAQQAADYQQYVQNRGPQEDGSTEKPPHCDGHDELGCFQVRLYYDWFLVPGSCKCWRPDYFARYVRRRQNNEL